VINDLSAVALSPARSGGVLVALLIAQFRLDRYVPGVYWSVVVVISVFGTLITDNLTDHPASR
jgi:uncharacterized membrane-anchored protein